MSNDDITPPVDDYEKTHPFELIVGDPGGEILNGDVAVRWCVTPALVAKLEEDGVIDPHVLLVSANEGREMQRQMVPITELMTYVRFTRAGEQDLFGFIISGADGRKKLQSTYFRKTNGDYETDIMFTYTKQPHDDLHGEYCRTSVKVAIPAGVFGKEPSAWMKWYVNAWHSSTGKIVDECHYRRRLMIAFTLKVIPFLIFTFGLIVFRLFISGVMMLAGYWKNNLILRCFRPYKWTNMELHVFDGIDYSNNPLIIQRKHTYENWQGQKITEHIPMAFTVPFIPLVLALQAFIVGTFAEYFGQTMLTITVALLTVAVLFDIGYAIKLWFANTAVFKKMANFMDGRFYVLSNYLDAHPVVLKTLGYSIFTFIVGLSAFMIFINAGILTFIIGLIMAFGIFVAVTFHYLEPFLTWLDNIYGISADQNNYGEIKELLCPKDEDNLRPNYNYIPPKQRTVRLWYLDLKNKVCKPMQS